MMFTKRARKIIPEQRPVPPQEVLSEAEKAHKKALDDLTAVRARGPEVSRVSQSLAALRERNHFAAQIQHMFYGGRP